jgi:predicted AlkP superfamily pyrophosphatase or phosphodiesterase
MIDAVRFFIARVVVAFAVLSAAAALSRADPGPPDPPPRNRRAAHVIIVSEDGLRPDALTAAAVHARAHEMLLAHGAHSLAARTIRHASTLPSHASMLSGVDDRRHGLFWNSWKPERGFIQVPTIFTAVEKAGMHAAAFVGKRKLEHITPPGSLDHFERPGYLCKRVVEEASRYFVSERPDLMFVHFSDPDEYGHATGWMTDRYDRGVADADRCLGKLLSAVAEAGLSGDTLIIVSADHGGHNRTHSGRLREDLLIPWIAAGPGVRQNYRIATPISTMDTAATVLYALGLPIPPDLEGRPVTEIFAR